ncbi:MAG TPA: hypothetical protein VNO55_09250, partial [Polyangia bacterium]|nr:hypothetical protein [Polyangia bacterium]
MHRSTEIAVFVLVLLSLGSVIAAELSSGVPIRISAAAAAPLIVFLSIPFLQSVPLPSAIVNRLDPAAAELIEAAPRSFRPLSLDPPATWLALGQAAAAMATVIIAAHLMSGRSFRYWFLRAVVLSGVAAVVIGVGHRILGEERIYGAFHASRGILNGPFINPNHTAQFLELGCFAALALAFAKSSIISRVGWTAAGVFLVAGALGTLSRGGVLALAISSALFVGLYRRASQEEGAPAPRRPWFVVALLSGLIAMVALSLGASQIVAKFTQANFSQETRFRLW